MKPWTFLMVAWFCMVSSAVHVPGIVQGQHNEIYAKEENLEPETTPRDYAFNTTNNSNFTCVNEEDNFPSFLTPQQQKNGGIIICVLIIMYFFTLLTIICDKYFLPAIEHLCEVLHLSPDVAAATFMSIATSCPELFTNIIATFVTNSELGIGTIVGSSMFNSLGAAAIGSLAAISKIQLDWWPITRDVFVYMITVSLLAGIIWDGYIYWYEGIALFVAFLVYFVIMFQNPRISRFVKKLAAKFQSKNDVSGNPGNSYQVEKDELEIKHHNKETVESSEETENDIFKIPQGGIWTKFIFFYCWPIRVILLYTTPDPEEHPKLFPITFVICVIWFAFISYVVTWIITIIGTTLGIPPAVQGLTVLAAGGSLPESVSLALLSRKGEGKMGISNSLGANSMNVLFSLGLPWFFKTILMGTNEHSYIYIDSSTIAYTVMALIFAAFFLYVAMFINKFRLSRTIGIVLLITYVICVVAACVSEVVLFPKVCS